MFYVIGDIHGCYDELQSMLEKIEFSPKEDKMFFVGDYIDRGKDSYKMLRWLDSNMKSDCYHFLKGNHEAEFIAYVDLLNSVDSELSPLEVCNRLAERSEYYDMYGTIRHMLSDEATKKKTPLTRWANMLRTMPTHAHFHYKHNNYLITHAGYKPSLSDDEKEDFCLYAREKAYTEGGLRNTIVIAGHTPTLIKGEFVYNHGNVFEHHDDEKGCTFYDIDCGCCFKGKDPDAKLACIRLDDKQIFYT